MPAPQQSEPAARRRLRGLALLPRRIAMLGVRVYQVVLSPLLPLVFGGGCGCRFHPTCSHFAVGALERHGLLAGAYLTVRRLLRCHPLHPGGEDPVPESFRWLPRRPSGAFVFSASRAGVDRLNRTHG